MSFEDMGKHLERSPMSVRLYVLRRKLTTGQLVKRNLLIALLKIKFRHPEDFAPTRLFYNETGIGQRRYWDLYFGRKPITGKEYACIRSRISGCIHNGKYRKPTAGVVYRRRF